MLRPIRLQCVGVGISAGLPCMGWTVRGSNPGGGRDYPHSSRSALGPTQPPLQWLPCLSPGVKSGRGVALTTHPPSSAVVKERVELYLYSPYGLSWPVLGELYLYLACMYVHN